MRECTKVVIVEDDYIIAEYFSVLCETMGVQIAGKVTNAEDAIPLIRETKPDFALLDVSISGDRDGVEIARAVGDGPDGVRIIFITGSSDPLMLERMRACNPYRVFSKPVSPEDLRAAIGLKLEPA